MKKYLTVLLAFTMAASLVSCSDSAKNSVSEPISAPLLSLGSADIRMADDFSEILCMEKKSSYFMIFGKLKTGNYSVYLTNAEFEEKTSFEFDLKDGESVKTAALMRTGKTAVMTVRGGDTIIYEFSVDGVCENEFNCGEIISPDDYFTELLSAEDGFYINVNRNFISYIDNNGEYSGNIYVSGRTVCGVVNDGDGVPCALLSEGEKLFLAELVGNSTANEISCGEIETYANAVGSGMGEYRLTAIFSGGLYGLKDSTWVKITDFSDNDFHTHNIFGIETTAENEFAALINHDDGSAEIRLLTERNISEIKQKKIIKMANTAPASNIDVYDDSMKKFNSENDEFKLEVVSYGDSDDPSDQLKLDIISGDAPDIIKFYTGTFIGGFNSRSDIFADFYTLMDNDEEIGRDMFLDGFLEGMETDGKLLQMYPTFTLNTVVIKDKFANGLTGWNVEQFADAYKNMPQDMFFSQLTAENTRTNVFVDFINCNAYVDYKNAKCSFDSAEFINAMKLIGENEIGLTEEQFDRGDRTTMFRDDVIAAYRNDKAMVFPWYVSSFTGIMELEQGYMGEPSTFIGYPTNSGNGTYRTVNTGYSIMSNSQNIDGAWEFLKYYLFSDDAAVEFGFSGLEEKYMRQLEEAKNPITEINRETGAEEQFERIFVLDAADNKMIEIKHFSDDEADNYDRFVCESLKNPIKSDDTINQILYEELRCYFEGERSAEETAYARNLERVHIKLMREKT